MTRRVPLGELNTQFLVYVLEGRDLSVRLLEAEGDRLIYRTPKFPIDADWLLRLSDPEFRDEGQAAGEIRVVQTWREVIVYWKGEEWGRGSMSPHYEACMALLWRLEPR